MGMRRGEERRGMPTIKYCQHLGAGYGQDGVADRAAVAMQPSR
jgi:hypothetical protein